MKNVKVQLKQNTKAWMIEKFFSYSGSDYQRESFPLDKFQMIVDNIDCSAINNVLDVGCNEGYVTTEFAKMGKFCVGVDNGPAYLNQVLTNVSDSFKGSTAAYGVFALKDTNVDVIPSFDLILLLSVHHQLVNRFGDDYAKTAVKGLIEKSNRYFVIEFAATRSKYGYSDERFKDNDESSVRQYAEAWIADLGVDRSVKYIGKNREHSSSTTAEPFRFSYLLTKT